MVGYEAEARLCDVLGFPSINMHPASAAGFVVPLVAGKAWKQTADVMAHGCVLGGARHMTLNSLLAGDLSMAKALAYSLSGAEAIRRRGSPERVSPGRSRRSNGCSIRWLRQSLAPSRCRWRCPTGESSARV